MSAFGFVLSFGPLYAVYALYLTRQLRGRDERYALRTLARAPLLFALLFAVVGTLYVVAQAVLRPSDIALTLVALLSGALFVGYAFAACIYTLYQALKFLRVIRAETTLPIGA